MNDHKNPRNFFLGAMVFLFAVAVLTLVIYFPRFTPLAVYLIAVNIAVFVLFGYDKGIAGSRTVRVPETVLFIGALAGGTLGILLAIKSFRHKVKKWDFKVVIAAILIVQVVAARLFFGKLAIDLFFQ